MLRCAIISDLHLGSCASRPRDVLRFLKTLETELLIINGDLLDSFPTKTLTQEEWEVLEFLSWGGLWEEGVRVGEVKWIRGNHDSTADVVASILGLILEDSFLLEAGDKKIYIAHGHLWDPSYVEGKYSFWTSLGNFFESLVGIFSLRAEIWWRRKRREFFRCDKVLEHRSWGDIITPRKAEVVVCGHTHWPTDIPDWLDTRLGDRVYVNGGSWTQDEITWVSVSNEGEVKLERFE